MLVATAEFKYGSYPFANFNYLQSICYPYHDKDINLVVSAATSAGKTVVAEQNMAHSISCGKKAIFLSPLKAVTQEKYDDWSSEDHFLSKYSVEIITGDYRLTESRVANIQKANLILMTSEMLDTRTRFFTTENNTWLKDVGILVVDESHLLCTNRGPALEVGLMRFSQINPSAKIVLLSATMTNSKDLGQWLSTLNGKHTEVIHTDWRPVELYQHQIKNPSYSNTQSRSTHIVSMLRVLTCPYSGMVKYLTSADTFERSIAEIRMEGIRQDPNSKEDVKTLVFVHTKDEGRKLCAALEEEGLDAYFHNADLDKTSRLKLEKKFKEDDLNILIATSTLAWGINMPARHVIVSGHRRGPDSVSDIDIKQMVGRAGRFGMYTRGDAFIVSTPDYAMSENFHIQSSLGNVNHLAFHLVAEIFSGTFNTLKGAEEWYRRSFNAIVDKKLELVRRALESLVLCQALTIKEKTYKVTMYGKIARDLYLNPQDIYSWKKNFQPKTGLISDWNTPAQVAEALTSHVSMFQMDYLPRELHGLSTAYKAHGGKLSTVKNLTYACVVWYRLKRATLEEYIVKNFDIATSPYFQTILKDSGRIFAALQRLNSYERWGREEELKSLQARVVHGVGEHLLDLVSIPGIGETVAGQLYKAGIHSRAQLIEQKNNLDKFITRKASITKILKGLEQLSSTAE